MPLTTQEAAIKVVKAVADAIKEAGSIGIPSGALYAMLMKYGCTINQYETLIGTMKRAGLIREEYNLLTWVGEKNN